MNRKHQICGYGVFYKMEGENRHVFQPILAENVQIAKKILTQLLVKVPLGDKITIKIAKENVEGMELMKRIGLDIKSSECETGPVMFTKYQNCCPYSQGVLFYERDESTGLVTFLVSDQNKCVENTAFGKRWAMFEVS